MEENRNTILIASDDENVLKMMATRCLELGLQVDAANSVIDVLRNATVNAPDVICLDADLAGGQGTMASELFLADERFAAIPQLLLSNANDDEAFLRGLQDSVHHVVKTRDNWATIKPILAGVLGLELESESKPDNSVQQADFARKWDRHDAEHARKDLLDFVFGLFGTDGAGSAEAKGRNLHGIGTLSALDGIGGFDKTS